MLEQTSTPVFDDFFITEQLDLMFSKIHIADHSLDKDAIHKELLKYYKHKFNNSPCPRPEYDFIDLFCGAGGLSVGLEQQGFYPVMAIDKDQSAILTYKFNRPWLTDNNVFHDDIRNLVGQYTLPHVSLIVGGPPCQGFSIANKHKRENDERNELYKFYVYSVAQSKPDIFLLENVEGILQLYSEIEKNFSRVGYITCTPLVLNAKDFGFPQSRKRVFILGMSEKYKKILGELYKLFTQTILAHLNEYAFNLWDAISDLPVLEAKTKKNSTYYETSQWGYTFGPFQYLATPYSKLINGSFSGRRLPLLNHRSKYNNERDIQIYQLLKPGEKSDAESIQTINPYKSRADIFRDKFDKLLANEPCKAITAHMYYDCNMYIHPTQARGLSPREAARIQGFPDDYLFLGSPNEWYRQIGNAVSPLMARVLGGGLKCVLERIYKV